MDMINEFLIGYNLYSGETAHTDRLVLRDGANGGRALWPDARASLDR